MLATTKADNPFQWHPQPAAAAVVQQLVTDYLNRQPRLRELSEQMQSQTGTRLTDWLDHLVVPSDENLAVEALHVGYELAGDLESTVFRHAQGMFAPLVVSDRRLHGDLTAGAAIKVENVDHFLQTHGLTGKVVP